MFQFTIRDLLWLTVVVALGVAWWVDRNRLAGDLYALTHPELTHEVRALLDSLPPDVRAHEAGSRVGPLD